MIQRIGQVPAAVEAAIRDHLYSAAGSCQLYAIELGEKGDGVDPILRALGVIE